MPQWRAVARVADRPPSRRLDAMGTHAPMLRLSRPPGNSHKPPPPRIRQAPARVAEESAASTRIHRIVHDLLGILS